METPKKDNKVKKIEAIHYEKTNSSFFSKYREAILAILIITIIGSAGYFYVKTLGEKEKFSAMEIQNQDLEQQLITRDSLINEWIILFDQVEADLKTIREKENMLSMNSDDLELNIEKREEVLADIQMLNSLLEENKQKIASLNSRLRNSGAKIASLEKKIEELGIILEARNQDIDSLKVYLIERDFQLADLNVKLTDMETDIGQKEAIIEIQETELKTAYVAYGSKKELESKGLVVKEGGFLGLGKTKSLKSDFPQNEFTAIDISTTTTIPVNSKDVELITEHPADSYKIISNEEDKLIAYIEINNPEEFWKISRYAIVETKK